MAIYTVSEVKSGIEGEPGSWRVHVFGKPIDPPFLTKDLAASYMKFLIEKNRQEKAIKHGGEDGQGGTHP
ncbi:hypothetical protein KJF94_07170 [Pseudomonas hormoni]|uniref:Uncharacterized protein n=1 Tax=Pseudomonas hormoni TaxID=3093767 RepID=A0ABX8F0L0_9PSED|nr:hypothetical protein [Pseudomonas hormoni]QVW25347.1 hypothetical protein KJF94_07170 [Pseudomonas hormoni]